MNDTKHWPDGFDGAAGLRDSLSAARAKVADLETALSLQESIAADAAAQVDALTAERDALRAACTRALPEIALANAATIDAQYPRDDTAHSASLNKAFEATKAAHSLLRAALAAGGGQ